MAAPKPALVRDVKALAPDSLSTAELADEFGRADNAYELAKPAYTLIKDRRDALSAEVQSRAVNEPCDVSTFYQGSFWRVEAGPKKLVAILPKMNVLHRLFRAAKEDFYGSCTVTLKLIEAKLGTPTFERIVTRTRTGGREVSAVLQQPKAA